MLTLFDIQAAFQNIAIKSSSGNELDIDASGFITVKGSGNFTVVATNFDIRDLTSASDSVEIKTAAGQALSIDGSGFLTVKGSGDFTVVATDLDIRDLTHASDSIKIGDGSDFLAVNSDGSINTKTSQLGFGSWKVTRGSVTNSAAELVPTPLTGRLSILIQNLGSNDVWLRDQAGVTTLNGFKLVKGGFYEQNLNESSDIFAITGSGSSDVAIVEYAA